MRVVVAALSYVAMFLPTCGVVQHGMVQKGGDRYAYLPFIALAVGLASVLADISDQALLAAGGGVDEDREEKPARAVPGVAAALRTIVPLVILPGLLFAGACGVIASEQVQTLRTEEAQYAQNLRVDPRDWRVLMDLAAMLQRAGRREEMFAVDRKLAEVLPPLGKRPLSSSHLPETWRMPPKIVAMWANLRLNAASAATGTEYHRLFGQACDIYEHGLADFPVSALLANNLGVCCLRTPETYGRARDLFALAAKHATVTREIEKVAANVAEMKANPDGDRPFRCQLVF